MEQFSKEGRKLRPRKSQSSETGKATRVESFGESRSEGPRKSFGSRNFGHNDENGERPRRAYNRSGEGRSFGEGGERREGRGFGGGREGGSEGRSFGGTRRSSGFGGRSAGPRRSFGEGEGRPGAGSRRSGEGSREGGSFGGARRSSGFGGRSAGPRRSFGEGEGRPGAGSRRSSEGRSYGERKPFGRKPAGKKPFDKNAAYFDKNSDEGINKMIGRRSAIDESKVSDNDYAPAMIKDEVRLNKFIANSGVCSRREADTLIQAGVVTVNGEVVTELGVKVNIYKDDIRFNGERLKGEEKVYLVMNKPKGFVTTASDPHADKTVIDLIKGCDARVYPVGRLDKNTTGVLMLTNDGEIAERLTHPSYDKKKIYQVFVDKAVSEEDYNKILSGIELTDGMVKADSLEYIDEGDKRKLGIEIHSGKNRIVRRIFESLGYNVIALDRVYFAGLTKKGLKKGEWRYLSEGEVNILKMGAYV